MHLLKLLGTLYKVKVNRLENLYNIKSYSYTNTQNVAADNFISYTVTKILNLCILEIKFSRVATKDALIPAQDMPLEFRPKNVVALAATYSNNSMQMDYHWLRLTPQGKFYTHNLAAQTVRNLQTTITYITAN